MRIGIFGGLAGGRGIDDAVAAARTAAADGFASFWLPQVFGVEALTVLAIIGRDVPGVELGTAVVPTYPRHPMTLAAQALTTQAACRGRLVLGIGLSHQLVIEGMFGYSFDKPLRHIREYLEVLVPLVRDGSVSFKGDTLSGAGALDVPGASPFPILLAALGPKMLDLAGTVADGTITWMTGPATLESHTVPTITAAAEKAGRAGPRVAAGIPVCVTGDADAARQRAARLFEIYGSLPSYRAMLDREGAGGPADVAVVGNEAVVERALGRFADAGTTDLVASEFAKSDDDRARTRELLRSMV